MPPHEPVSDHTAMFCASTRRSIVWCCSVLLPIIVATGARAADDEKGKPLLTFHGKAKQILDQLGARTAWISITHSPDHAVAVAVLES